MTHATRFAGFCAGLFVLLPTAVLACGEGQFNMGHGLRYQGYLAPRPATVLIYAESGGDADLARRDATYEGLQFAGHAVTVVGDGAALERALAEQHYDVVIARLDRIETLAVDAGLASNSPHLLPLVSKGERRDATLRARYKPLLPDGATLTQYLKAINQAVAAGTP